MGCANSKTEDLPLVVLCRERRELIRAAADHRYVLAAAHAAYFRALDRVGDALHRFAGEELVVAPDSPILTLPPSEGKPPRSKSSGSSARKADSVSEAVVSFPPSPSSSTVSPFSGSHLKDECHHLHRASGSDVEESFDRRNGGGGSGEGWNSFPHSMPFPAFPHANYYYMKSAPLIASTVYQDPYGEQWTDSQSQRFAYSYGYGYPSFANGGSYYYEPPGMSRRDEGPVAAASEDQRTSSPPPPPPPQGSSWDFFNPFDSYEQMLNGHVKSRSGLGSVASSPNSSEVREQEGIPELEEETEQESVKGARSKNFGEKRVLEDDSERFNSSVGSSEAVTIPHVDENSFTAMSNEEEISGVLGEGNLKNGGVEGVHVRKEGISFTETATTGVMLEDSGQKKAKDAALSIHRTRDVIEAVKEMTDQFKSAACCGEEVSKLLEVGKMRYRPRIKIFRGATLLKTREISCTEFEKYIAMKSCNLSSTLEQLYMWEKKLYKEVKDEEKLRVFYDREYSRLKALDDRGAEPNKIDSTRSAINKLITKISMTIKSVDAISRRIHKLRDEELQPQLIELIHGLIRMWRSMLDCHQKQFQAIVEAKSQKLLCRSIPQQNSATKATIDLELELMNWCSCFSNWVRAQKAYIESLNQWLMKWLLQEQEETTDGVVPFSPGRVGAPAVFVISNDWHHVVERMSEDEVLSKMHLFATNLHKLWESQDEEQQQKLKAEYLTNDFTRMLNALNGNPDAAGKIMKSSSNDPMEINVGPTMSLDQMRRRLEEERRKHEEAVKQIQEVASSSLRTGLIPIIEALENYTSETLKGYSEVRLLNNAEIT
ncbi:hypothetical protein AXF42_Ash019545 [Apostasia shenzhenica]|uniref:DUF632 domain-containing protein n=1 Tax=Apostasia shenzhenica TaxID=1088818 RepID=A0A2I0A0E2_9ASPA|nr:hypothetical protein AXF42_Ash019545 [Apostasia shenzhenica]